MVQDNQRKPRYDNKSANYVISKDYTHLKELIDKGVTVICFVDVGISETWEYVFQHIALAYKNNLFYEIASQGISYITWYDELPFTFEQLCEENNVEFIEPTKYETEIHKFDSHNDYNNYCNMF